MSDFLLAFLAACVFLASVAMWARSIKRVEIPDSRSPFVIAWLVAFSLGVVALLGDPGWFGGLLAAIATFGSTFLLFTVAISKQKLGAEAIRVGDTIPGFTALDENDQTFDSQSLAGHPVLIKFFRAHW